MLDQLGGVDGSVPSYPPYNIARATEYAYRISVAVAGFTDADLSVETKENRLTIHGEKSRPTTRKRPARCSTRASPGHRRANLRASFQLADYVKVKGASLENRLLHVDLVHEIPEARKKEVKSTKGRRWCAAPLT
jgi:molecular chaperone IbpA